MVRPNTADHVLKGAATLWFIGYLPYAPGTWGSISGLFLLMAIPPSQTLHFAIAVTGFIVGAAAAGRAEKLLQVPDSSHIVIDECIGILVATLLLPRTFGVMVSAFLLFRFFDILKPFPIRLAEKSLHGGFGVMTDDVLAGIYTNLLLQIWIRIYSTL